MRTTLLIGEPATGKSTIMKALLTRGDFTYRNDLGLPRHEDPVDGLVVFGRYDEEHQFPGTDRLHMGIKPTAMFHAEDYMKRGWHVIWEGARLGHPKTVRDLQAMGAKVRIGWVVTDIWELQVRRALERKQSQTMLKRMMTSVRNMSNEFEPIVTVLRHDRPDDTAKAVDWILAG